MKTVFWIIVAVSSGPYNAGSVSQIDAEFISAKHCQAALDQIAEMTWGKASLLCIRMEGVAE